MLIVIGEEVVYIPKCKCMKGWEMNKHHEELQLRIASLLKSANKSLNVLYGFAL